MPIRPDPGWPPRDGQVLEPGALRPCGRVWVRSLAGVIARVLGTGSLDSETWVREVMEAGDEK